VVIFLFERTTATTIPAIIKKPMIAGVAEPAPAAVKIAESMPRPTSDAQPIPKALPQPEPPEFAELFIDIVAPQIATDIKPRLAGTRKKVQEISVGYLGDTLLRVAGSATQAAAGRQNPSIPL
jgi:hypothetical protein